MAMGASPLPSPDRAPALLPAAAMSMQLQPQPPVMVTDAVAKDAIIAWYRGEFAAANAIIDALCAHLVELGVDRSEYEPVFAAMHRRRMNWIPVLQMQKFHSIAEVTVELKRVAARRAEEEEERCDGSEKTMEASDRLIEEKEKEKACEESLEKGGNNVDVHADVDAEEGSPESDITDSGSQDMHPISEEDFQICSDHGNCEARAAQIKLTKGFKAKEMVKGHMVNIVKGLKLYEDVFNDSELCKLTSFVNELRLAGRKGELSGDSFILFNEQIKGSKRESIQFGLPIFEQIQDEDISNNNSSKTEQIPAILQDVVDHLVQWQLIPTHKQPNSCIINFFDEGDYSQPFLKPPHLDQPISTLYLSESTMAFGRNLACDSDGNYKGSLMLSLKEGSLLVRRGNSSDISRHAMCSSPIKRVTITFFRVRVHDSFAKAHASTSPLTGNPNYYQPNFLSPYALPNGVLSGYKVPDMVPKVGIVTPLVMLAPLHCPVVLSSPEEKIPCEGTGVFLPWTVRKPMRRLPPRARKGR